MNAYFCGSTHTLKVDYGVNGDPEYYNYILLDLRKPGRYCYEGLTFSLLYEPFYVGKGKGYRYTSHFSPSTLKPKSYKNNLIKNLLTKWNRHQICLRVNKALYEVDAYFVEEELILHIGRKDLSTGPLVNQVAGGEHMWGISPEVRKSYGSPKEKHPLWGIGHTEESKRKVAENRDYSLSTGENNGRAKRRLFISPEGNEILVSGTFEATCQRLNFCPTVVYRLLDKGVVLQTKRTRKFDCPVGWEFKNLDNNHYPVSLDKIKEEFSNE